MSFFTCSSVAFSSTFLFKTEAHPLLQRYSQSKSHPFILDFFINKHHRGKSNLCHAEIIYPIIDIVLLSNILWMLFEEKIDWFELQSVLIHKS